MAPKKSKPLMYRFPSPRDRFKGVTLAPVATIATVSFASGNYTGTIIAAIGTNYSVHCHTGSSNTRYVPSGFIGTM